MGEDSRRLTMWWWEPRISDCFKFLGQVGKTVMSLSVEEVLKDRDEKM